MKMIRKTLILILFVMISVASMVTGVFAWFLDPAAAKIQPIGGELESEMTIDIQIDQSEIFLGDRLRDLVYVTDEDFHTVGFDFYGYGAILELDLQNSGSEAMNARVALAAQDAPDYGIYAGVNTGFKYLFVDDPANVTSLMFSFQQSSDVFAAMNFHNSIGVTIPANTTVKTYVFIWGYYDGLPNEQKDIYHAIVYRMKFSIY